MEVLEYIAKALVWAAIIGGAGYMVRIAGVQAELTMKRARRR